MTGGTTIPNGIYSVSLFNQDLFGNPPVTTTATGISIDTATSAPTLVSPATGTSYINTLPVQFSVPESSLSGSLKLIFTNANNTVDITLNDSALSNFDLDVRADPVSNSNVQSATASSIPYGTYDVSFSYRDLIGNEAASSIATGVVITDVAAEPVSPSTSH